MRVLCAYLLWLPPLGWLGLHQCYLGRHYHAVWIFTTFAGFFIGWFRDLWRIPAYAAAPPETTEFSNNSNGCCCDICTRLKQCVKNCLCRRRSGQQEGNTLSNNASEKKDDLSDEEDHDPASQTAQKPAGAVEGSLELKAVVTKVIEELVELQLRKEFEDDGGQPPAEKSDQMLQVHDQLKFKMRLKIEELTQESISIEGFETSVLQNKRVDEEEVRRRVELLVKHSLKEERVKVERTKTRKVTLSLSTARDPPCSDNEDDDDVEVCNRRKKTSKKQTISVMDNIERVLGAFITARYYRGLVTAALSDYLEAGWVIHCFLKLLPSIGMMCGVYLVSNIGKPPRLTLSALLLSGVVGEALFGVIAEILYGRSWHVLACLVCTAVAVYFWQWPTSESDEQSNKVYFWQWPTSTKQSNKYSCFTVTLCACVVMTLVWGSIIMNTTIEVDEHNVTISEALHNFYNSPAWSQMKIALWDAVMMYSEGNWDEASETLLRMSDLSGAERALSVLGLSRDASEADIKAQYKKLAREWHPDKYQGQDKEAATNKFIEIQQAYTLLTKRIRA